MIWGAMQSKISTSKNKKYLLPSLYACSFSATWSFVIWAAARPRALPLLWLVPNTCSAARLDASSTFCNQSQKSNFLYTMTSTVYNGANIYLYAPRENCLATNAILSTKKMTALMRWCHYDAISSISIPWLGTTEFFDESFQQKDNKLKLLQIQEKESIIKSLVQIENHVSSDSCLVDTQGTWLFHLNLTAMKFLMFFTIRVIERVTHDFFQRIWTTMEINGNVKLCIIKFLM